MVELVARTGQAFGEIGDLALIALPVAAHGIAKAIVPFGPARRKAAHLVAAGTTIPRLGNQPHSGEHRVLPATVEEASAFVEPVGFTAEDSVGDTPETVDLRFTLPVEQ